MEQLPECVAEVIPGVYLGDITSLQWTKHLKITHVLLRVLDMETANLLRHFPWACDFLHKGSQGNHRVLVVIAHLMKLRSASADDMLRVVQGKRPSVQPNTGFMLQLDAWQHMGFTCDRSHVSYGQAVRMLEVAQRWNEASVDLSTLAAPDAAHSQSEAAYKCRGCRTLLATQRLCIPVPRGGGQVDFDWRKRDKHWRKDGNGSSVPETSIFTEPLQWMEGITGGAVQGKLHCPTCQARLGSFNWSGSQASSGRWVVPAFQLHLSKLDEEVPASMFQHAIRCGHL